MLIPNGDGTFQAGPFDVLCILHRFGGRFHPAFFEESPMPGPYPDRIEDVKVVRLRSRMHHTEGAETIEVALMQLAELSKKISVPLTNIWLKPIVWDGGEGIVFLRDNWLRDPAKAYNDLQEALKNPSALLAAIKADIERSP